MMTKRNFIRLFAAAFASPVLSPLLSWAFNGKLTNWAGNIEYSTDRLYSADSLDQVRSYVEKQSKLKVLGTRHCFNNIADSKDNLLSLKSMDEVVALDSQARTVTVDAGMTYGQLCPYLDSKGFALHNLASLPHISIAGACSTATHGSGDKNGNLATAVSGLEMVNAAGEVVKLSRQKDGEVFRGAVVGLGAAVSALVASTVVDRIFHVRDEREAARERRSTVLDGLAAVAPGDQNDRLGLLRAESISGAISRRGRELMRLADCVPMTWPTRYS